MNAPAATPAVSLNAEELDALRGYARAHGRYWKRALRQAWAEAREPGVLQALRNAPHFGPAGLRRLRIPPDWLA